MKHYIHFALRALSCLTLILLTLELSARLEDKLAYRAPFFGNYSSESLYGYDALGKVGIPYRTYLKWHLNDAGYRGPDLRQGTYRIACIGSSETFGLYESPGMEWPRQLEDILAGQRGDRAFETVDVAYPGMTMSTSLERLPQMLAVVRPKIAVIYPAYTSYVEAIPHPHVTEPIRPPGQIKEHRSFELRLTGRMETFFKANLPEPIQNWLRERSIAAAVRGRPTMERVPEQNVKAFENDLDKLTTQLLQQDVRVILVTHANRFGRKYNPSDYSMLTNWRKFYPTLQQGGFIDMENRMSEVVRKVAGEHSVPLVDGALLVPPGKNNFADFAHFTDSGSKILATAIASEILREEASPEHEFQKNEAFGR